MAKHMFGPIFALFTPCGKNDETNRMPASKRPVVSLSIFTSLFQAGDSLGSFLSLGKPGKDKLD